MSDQPTERRLTDALTGEDLTDQHCAHCDGAIAWGINGYAHTDPNSTCIAFDGHDRQPSAVQAPERIWISPQFATEANTIGGGIFRLCDDDGDCTQYIHIDAYETQAARVVELEAEARKHREQNERLRERLGWKKGQLVNGNIKSYEAQAVRIRELEDALMAAVEVIEDMRSENKLHGHITDGSARYLHHVKPQVDAALKPKEGK